MSWINAFSSSPFVLVRASRTSWRLYPFSTSLRITGSGNVAGAPLAPPPWAEMFPELDDWEIFAPFDEVAPLEVDCPLFEGEGVDNNLELFESLLLDVLVFEPPKTKEEERM